MQQHSTSAQDGFDSTAEQATVLLGHPAMDAVHAEFGQLATRAQACADGQLYGCLQALHAHLLSHFAAEDAWMRDTRFPATDCHVEEHAAVLRSSAQVLPRVAEGHAALGRDFLAHLADWFPGHADYLDSALAAWLCRRQYGGRPVVLHRKPKTTSRSPD